MPDDRNVYQRLRDVRLALASISKDGTSPKAMGEYKYVRWDDVADQVGTAMAENGLVTVPSLGIPEIVNAGTSNNGNVIWSTRVGLALEVVNVDNPDDRTIATWQGEAQDAGDKGIQKAATSATKYCLMKLLQLAGADDTEADVTRTAYPHKTDQPIDQYGRTAPPAEKAPVCELCAKLGFTTSKGMSPRLYTSNNHPEYGPSCNGLDAQGRYLNHRGKPAVRSDATPNVLPAQEYDENHAFMVGDACPFEHDDSPYTAKFQLAKGGPARGSLQCSGKLNGQFANHLAPPPARKQMAMATSDPDLTDEIPF